MRELVSSKAYGRVCAPGRRRRYEQGDAASIPVADHRGRGGRTAWLLQQRHPGLHPGCHHRADDRRRPAQLRRPEPDDQLHHPQAERLLTARPPRPSRHRRSPLPPDRPGAPATAVRYKDPFIPNDVRFSLATCEPYPETSWGAGRTRSSASCRSRYRWVFPLIVLGSSVTNSTTRGYLYGAIEALTKSCSSTALAASPAAASRNTTNACTIMPRSSCGAPTTATSSTSGWPSRASSTSGPAML